MIFDNKLPEIDWKEAILSAEQSFKQPRTETESRKIYFL